MSGMIIICAVLVTAALAVVLFTLLICVRFSGGLTRAEERKARAEREKRDGRR